MTQKSIELSSLEPLVRIQQSSSLSSEFTMYMFQLNSFTYLVNNNIECYIISKIFKWTVDQNDEQSDPIEENSKDKNEQEFEHSI